MLLEPLVLTVPDDTLSHAVFDKASRVNLLPLRTCEAVYNHIGVDKALELLATLRECIDYIDMSLVLRFGVEYGKES